MALEDLRRSLRQLRSGVGQTTQKNRVLPFPPPDIPIPARIGTGTAVPKEADKNAAIRGFVLTAFGAFDGIRFNPYTLQKLETHYQPEALPYAVMPWATAWNVIDTTKWHDVVSFYHDEILINAAGMPALAIPVATLPGPAIPYVIPSTIPGAKYGDSTVNGTEKRVFAVGRDYVKSWGGGGVTITLGPATPGKSMALGQRAAASNTAILSKVYFTGESWDSLGGSWQISSATATISLAAPYLQAVTSSALVEMPLAIYGAPANSSPSIDRGYSLPATAVGLIGIGEISHVGSMPLDLRWTAVFPWRETFSAPRTGRETGTSSLAVYDASASHSGTYAGRDYGYACGNSKTFTTESTSISYLADSFPTGTVFNGPTSAGEYKLSVVSNALSWDDGNDGAIDRGVPDYHFPPGTVSGSTISRTVESQVITASVICGGIQVFSLSITVEKSTGQQRVIAPDNSFYTSYLANPYGWIGSSSGIGQGGRVNLLPSQELIYYNNPSGYWENMPQASKNEIVAKFNARIGQFAGKRYFDYEASGGIYHSNFYTSTILSNQQSYSATLSVSARDDLFFDETNGVHIWIESTLTGSQGAGAGTCTVTVTLKIQTRYASTSQQLASRTYAGTLLPEYQINPPATPTAVPSPRIKAFFCPIHLDQGSFKGAAYVTLAEEANGATPAHLINFRLKLRKYDAIISIDAENRSSEYVHFIPFNLIELLYAFVYSGDYGIGASTGERYPITRQDRYDDLETYLFQPIHEVHLRDGSAGSWASSLGGDSAGLYRT